ncbi:MAG TPA: site-specific integrase [Verrucomicrobiota bacterium]|nr:site-specific integrase [Verrucomicrobiota bacterium]
MTIKPNTTGDTKSRKQKRSERLSPDGKWKSFPRVPNLLQYVSTGIYFARVKVNGKLIRRSLETTVYSDALLKLGDFIKTQRKSRRHTKGAPSTFREARLAYEADLDNTHTIADSHRNFRKWCLKSLLKSWPELDASRLTAIKPEACKEWAKRFSEENGPQYFNNVLGTFRSVLKRAGYGDDESPLREVKRLGVPVNPPQLPEPDQFMALLKHIESQTDNPKAQHCADLVRFLAFSGCRLAEAQRATFRDMDLDAGVMTIHSVKTRKAKRHYPTRVVPIIADMRELLLRLKAHAHPDDFVCKVKTCQGSITKACAALGIPKITHHDLRHLFATRCIESGVDIPTVSRWLGHSDGGVLAMKVYGHLREKHSADMAARVTFQPKEAA